ncbi:MAG: hypothetical protein CVU09_00135 [Bacteroidetes bacterium HGW-Bacteroidetes-4]|jgi:hypothetical protein|nr:MAG: hypothetical protein CVU09_00135 [Bacteroidetes bacterium HGW-Bacteroidetes-4]
MRLLEITPVFVETIPQKLEDGKLYISKEFGIVAHSCACGCGGRCIMDLKPYWKDGWTLTEHGNNVVSLSPSVGNWSGENPYHAHYFIKNNKIDWL